MPRLRGAAPEAQAVEPLKSDPVEPLKVQETEKQRWGKDPFEGLELKDLKPFTTRAELPKALTEMDSWENKEGHKIYKRRVACGEPRFFMEQNPGGRINLIGKYENGKGVAQRNIRTIKPFKDTQGLPKELVERYKEDKRIFAQLKDQGIPVIAAMAHS